MSESVKRVVRLTTASNVAAESIGEVVAWDGTSLLVDLSNVDLDRTVVLSLDDSVGGRALSWHVKFDLNNT